MIYCKDCVYGVNEYCCNGCDSPSDRPLASCGHYRGKEVLVNVFGKEAEKIRAMQNPKVVDIVYNTIEGRPKIILKVKDVKED